MIETRNYCFEIGLTDIIEDLVIKRDGTVSIMFTRSEFEPDEGHLVVRMTFERLHELSHKIQRAEAAIDELYADAQEERSRKHAMDEG